MTSTADADNVHNVSVHEIITPSAFLTDSLERIAVRKETYPLEIVEADASWPDRFADLQTRIQEALGTTALSIEHVGSTSVPGLPAKDVIDVDLIVADVHDEASYVPALEAAGFHFLLREPGWHSHRFFVYYKPNPANLHVWGRDSPETVRHLIMRDWLRGHEPDRELYAKVKRECAEATRLAGGNVMDYTSRKNETIQEILRRAYIAKGYIKE